MDGIFNVDKPAGLTSHDVVAHVRRLAHQKRVGHAGTLDPMATGVLPICVGQATRVAEYLSESGKAYRATIRFGVVTDTYDVEGQVLRTAPVVLTREEIATVLPDFLGTQLQVPPIYSAIKRGGLPLYKLARAGAAVPVEPRPVEIYALTIVSWQSPDLVLDVECGKGTYIRSLAFDLGERLGPGAHLTGLVRTRSGPFTLETSVPLAALEQAFAEARWADYLYAPDEALLDRQAAILGAESETRVRTGQPLRFALPLPIPPASLPAGETGESGGQETAGAPTAGEALEPERLLRAYTVDGRFLGILRWERELATWQPHKVLLSEPVE
jgi:tRNA pseudouridine55 synthase